MTQQESEKQKIDEEYKELHKRAWDDYQNDNSQKALELSSEIIREFPERIGGYYISALVEFDSSNYIKSVEHLKNALSNNVENKGGGFIHYFLGRNYNEKSKDYFKDFVENPIYSFEMARFSFEKSIEFDEYPKESIEELIKIYRKDNYKTVNLLKNAIKKFKDNVDFIIKYSRALTAISKKEDALTIVSNKANELNSPSLFYEAGFLLQSMSDFASARLNFEKALELHDGRNNGTAFIHYQIADSYYKEKEFQNAFFAYKKSFDLVVKSNLENSDYIDRDYWLSLFGIIAVQSELSKFDEIENCISVISFNEEQIEHIDFIGQFFLDSGQALDYITDIDFGKCLTVLNEVKKISKDKILISKINWLKFILYQEDNKLVQSLNALREASKNDDFSNNYIFEKLSSTYYYCIHDKICDKKEYYGILNKLNSDLEKEQAFRNNFDEYYIEKLIEWLFSDKNYQAIIDLKKHFTSIQLDKADSWFEIAYSYGEIKDVKNSQKSYEHYLTINKTSTAALNNLANIYKDQNKLDTVEKALKMYEKAIKIDGDKELYIRNLKNTKAIKESLLKEKSKRDFLEKTFKRAIKLLNKEDYFSLETLHNFLLNIGKDDDYENGEIPIQTEYFPSLMNTNIAKADKLKEVWLSKNYIFLTDDFDSYNIPIYKINPYLQGAVNQQRKVIAENDLPIKWLEGIEGLNVSKLEEIQYFNIISKIGKINKKYKPLIERDFNELVFNHLVGNIKSTIVLSGSFVELILTYYLERKKQTTIQYSNSRPKNIYDCNLFDLISFSEEKGYFGKDFFHLTNLSRVYRNFIHPGLELKNELNKGKSDLCFISTLEIFKII